MVGQMESGGGGSLPVRHPTLFLLPWVRLYGLPLSCWTLVWQDRGPVSFFPSAPCYVTWDPPVGFVPRFFLLFLHPHGSSRWGGTQPLVGHWISSTVISLPSLQSWSADANPPPPLLAGSSQLPLGVSDHSKVNDVKEMNAHTQCFRTLFLMLEYVRTSTHLLPRLPQNSSRTITYLVSSLSLWASRSAWCRIFQNPVLSRSWSQSSRLSRGVGPWILTRTSCRNWLGLFRSIWQHWKLKSLIII